MNLKIEILVNFEEDEEQLDRFIADLGRVIVEWNLGNDMDEDIKSVLAVTNFKFDTSEEYEEWLQEQVDEGAFLALPVSEMEDMTNA